MSERETLFVNVILPIPIRKEFTYRVPYEMNDKLFPGARVVVPFGRSTQSATLYWLAMGWLF